MPRSLLFLPDISGFTRFVQTTEVEHSQHVIAELLEILIQANTQDLLLAEVEGDALFFYKENQIPSREKLLAQAETMFTAFYSHLKLLETNRICPCNACATAPNLQLKIIAHSGELQFITVQGARKPFGQQVIEAHRLMKNSVDSDEYVLISSDLAKDIDLPADYTSPLFQFQPGADEYDDRTVSYLYAMLDTDKLQLQPFSTPQKVHFDYPPQIVLEKNFPVSATTLLEYVTNYTYREYWVKGVDRFDYPENEVTRLGTEHVCVINGKHLDFVTVTKDVESGQLVYGELTTSPPPVDRMYQFFVITPETNQSCHVRIELYWEARSIFKKLAMRWFGEKSLRKSLNNSVGLLGELVVEREQGMLKSQDDKILD